MNDKRANGGGRPTPPGSILSLACAIALVVACSEPATRADAPTPTTPTARTGAPGDASNPAGASRIGTVGLVRVIKERGLTSGNWFGVIGSLFSYDSEKDVIRVRYEVTVLYPGGDQGEVIVYQHPGVQAGQKVRVTGNRIEALDR